MAGNTLHAAVEPDDTQASVQCWLNPEYCPDSTGPAEAAVSLEDVHQAEARLARFAPLLRLLFPELESTQGLVESPLLPLAQTWLVGQQSADSVGTFWIKGDHQLPVAGSIKARGGFHEVLEFAERVALRHGLVLPGESYAVLASPAARACFAQYEVAVGSTGNLGLSIGILSAALGFRPTVHMSCEAKEWKKQRLRQHGVTVHEHEGDYGQAVEAGRALAASDPNCHFVDDEQSVSLFVGYAVAALRLRRQLELAGVTVDASHPLFVYLPCGVGGAPGGVAFGLKQVFGAAVHCVFVEPVASSCFLVQMQHPDQPGISIYQAGQSNRTAADGLAVPSASQLVFPLMRPLLSAIATVTDQRLYADLWQLHAQAGIRIEPSAAAAFGGLRAMLGSLQGRDYLARHGLLPHLPQANHIAWTTGGLFVPETEYQRFLDEGRAADRTLRDEPVSGVLAGD